MYADYIALPEIWTHVPVVALNRSVLHHFVAGLEGTGERYSFLLINKKDINSKLERDEFRLGAVSALGIGNALCGVIIIGTRSETKSSTTCRMVCSSRVFSSSLHMSSLPCTCT
ncbi:hypothetical protein PsorP6_000080 [Peronosclerospora sorghi]|uniref:Uncharacterized protein n=1 Tax=Peronosclerospora sorghi TaxID=230839 RepID=A0ACC0WTL8_9STRA|nr:hypothetical protein PsorP6_000080 [Peronosclerospora sorghi]